jgi:hypothetical protein
LQPRSKKSKSNDKVSMENTQFLGHPVTGLLSTCVCIISGVIASIITNIELWVRIGAGGIAMISGLMAIRYYYYATKEKQQSLNK